MPSSRSEVCWAAVSKDDRYAYVTNFGDGTISSYTIGDDGDLSLLAPVAATTVDGQKGIRDEAFSADGEYLYALHPDARHDLRLVGRGRRVARPHRRVRQPAGDRGRPGGHLVRLEPLYRVRFTTPEAWSVEIDASGSQSFLIAEGRCEGAVHGRYRGANFPRRRPDGTTAPDFRGVIETDDGRDDESVNTTVTLRIALKKMEYYLSTKYRI